MKIREVYDSVAKLGEADSLDDVNAFFYALNRAILQVNSLKPMTAILEINRCLWDNLVREPHFEVDEYKGENLIYEASAPVKSFHFEVLGRGTCYVQIYTDDMWQTKLEIKFDSREFIAKRGLIRLDDKFTDKPVRISFFSEFSFKVRCVAMWGQVLSLEDYDIPAYSRYDRYELDRIREDFLSLDDKPFTEEFERLVGDYVVEDRRVLLIERGEPSEIRIKYNKKPARLEYTVSVTEDERELELDAELAELVPLLVSSYIWLEDEPEKATTYLSLYRERAAEIFARRKTISPRVMMNTNGW